MTEIRRRLANTPRFYQRIGVTKQHAW